MNPFSGSPNSVGVSGGVFLFLLQIAFPYATARGHKSGRALRLPRIALYVSSSLTLWLLIALMIVVLHFQHQPLATTGVQNVLSTIRLTMWAGGLVLVGLLIGWLCRGLQRKRSIALTETVRHAIPRTAAEFAVFCVLLAPTAGVMEEVLFRGFVITRLSWLIGDAWLAAIVASLSFALGHVYQGWIGLLRTGLGGLAFSLAFVLTGSLLPSILAHTVLNLLSAPLFRPRDHLAPTRR